MYVWASPRYFIPTIFGKSTFLFYFNYTFFILSHVGLRGSHRFRWAPNHQNRGEGQVFLSRKKSQWYRARI